MKFFEKIKSLIVTKTLRLNKGAVLELVLPDGTISTIDLTELGTTVDEVVRVQELLATGDVTVGVESVELNHATVPVLATIADAANHAGMFVVKDTSASGTAAHSLTLTSGTFDGTNNVVTFNAPDDALMVYFDSAGNGTIIENVGAAVLS